MTTTLSRTPHRTHRSSDLAGYYVFIQHLANALRFELDADFYGWNLENH